jgi:hypothetical protein
LSYLIANDYIKGITDVTLQQVIAGNAYLQTWAELTAIKQVCNYLRQKYDVDAEFSSTLLYNPNTIYKASNRVYLNASPYSTSSTYSLKDLILQAGKIYQCSTAIGVAEQFNATKWTLLGDQYEIFYALYPRPLFNINSFYAKGDLVFWKDKNYTALLASHVTTHDEAIQYGNTNSIPFQNVFPGDKPNGSQYWQDNGAYTVAAGSLLDATKWVSGDNRHPQLVMFTIDVALYHLYGRIAPKSIPDVRTDRYNAAIAELRMMAKGDISTDIQKIQPDKGSRIRAGSNVKQQNSY